MSFCYIGESFEGIIIQFIKYYSHYDISPVPGYGACYQQSTSGKASKVGIFVANTPTIFSFIQVPYYPA